jgi:SAM-dependent methyltransferase
MPHTLNDTSSETEWFGQWFNSPYYHLLYKNRDDNEARKFLDNLTLYLGLKPHHTILDLACGRGRHAIYLNSKGLCVEGIDLSAENIQVASLRKKKKLSFFEHDMRLPYKHEAFDYVINMFTSFGYFETEEEDLAALRTIYDCLKPDGTLVMDFFNSHKVINRLQPENVVVAEGVEFHIQRRHEDGFIVKDIRFQDKGHDYHFTEKVKAFSTQTFRDYFGKTGRDVVYLLGSYQLTDFHPQASDRMIWVVQKM